MISPLSVPMKAPQRPAGFTREMYDVSYRLREYIKQLEHHNEWLRSELTKLTTGAGAYR